MLPLNSKCLCPKKSDWLASRQQIQLLRSHEAELGTDPVGMQGGLAAEPPLSHILDMFLNCFVIVISGVGRSQPYSHHCTSKCFARGLLTGRKPGTCRRVVAGYISGSSDSPSRDEPARCEMRDPSGKTFGASQGSRVYGSCREYEIGFPATKRVNAQTGIRASRSWPMHLAWQAGLIRGPWLEPGIDGS